MIFYFSATGNSKYAAQRIAAVTEDRLVSLRDAIPMVDNYVPAFTIPGEEETERILDRAEAYIDEAGRAVRSRGAGDYNRCKGPAPSLQTAAMYPSYARGRSTRPFVVTDGCIGCGLCQEICPCGAISLSGGQPVWAKRTCVQCLGCLHRCPVEAIHWKKADEERGRYYNPRVEP